MGARVQQDVGPRRGLNLGRVAAFVGIWVVRIVLLLFVWLLVDYAGREDRLANVILSVFAVLLFLGAFARTVRTVEWIRDGVAGVLFGLGLYGVFAGTGLTMVLEPDEAVAESQRNPGGKAPDLRDRGDATVMGVFLLVLGNLPLVLIAGGIVTDKVRAARQPDESVA